MSKKDDILKRAIKNSPGATAISRNKLSTPLQYLVDNLLIIHPALDYGSGRGQNADELKMDKFDLIHHPKKPSKKYKTITCNYVLNVIEDADVRAFVIDDIKKMLLPGGKAYISVRNDVKSLVGHTVKGTYQTLVSDEELISKGFRLVRKNSNHKMYEYAK